MKYEAMRLLDEFLGRHPSQDALMKEVLMELTNEPDFLGMSIAFVRASTLLGRNIYRENEKRINKHHKKIQSLIISEKE